MIITRTPRIHSNVIAQEWGFKIDAGCALFDLAPLRTNTYLEVR
jgi:hypothetical protein